MVFLHYFGGSARSWDLVIDRLWGQHRCVAPDLCGFGDSPSPIGMPTLAGHANDVVALLGALQIRSSVLIGHTLSG